MSERHRYRFAGFELDAGNGELSGPEGRRRRLEPQPAQVLAILVARAGEVVTREDLQREVWPQTHVDFDQGINYCIRRIRSALGDAAEAPRFIETLPRRGYRFVAPVEGDGAVGPAGRSASAKPDRGSDRRGRALLAGVGLLLVASLVTWWLVDRNVAPPSPPPTMRIAVLPFHGLDAPASDWEQRLTEALVVNLTREGVGLAVIGPATTAPAEREGLPQGELGRRFGADFVLSGGIRQDGESVFAQLIGAPGGEHLWATVQPLGEPDTVGVELASAALRALNDKATRRQSPAGSLEKQ